MTFPPIIVFLAGLVVIIVGAEFVLRGASRIATLLKVKPILIGLTVVSVGTSLPELAIGIEAVSEGRGSLAVGNIAGTNIFNILFILGLSAAIRPLPLQLLSIRLDVPVMILTTIVLVAMASDGALTRTEGIILVIMALIYTTMLIRLSLRESPEMKQEFAEEFGPKVLLRFVPQHVLQHHRWLVWIFYSIQLIIGMGLTIIGADLLLSGAVNIAATLGVSEAIIGLTIVAVGTSAPELATTIIATLKDERDVAIGNLIGSSISNVLVILGITSIAAPTIVDVSKDVLWVDLPLAAAVAIACYPVFRSNRRVSRKEGLLFLAVYIVYMSILIIFRT